MRDDYDFPHDGDRFCWVRSHSHRAGLASLAHIIGHYALFGAARARRSCRAAAVAAAMPAGVDPLRIAPPAPAITACTAVPLAVSVPAAV
jgi:hypothetical protein